ncbi:SMR family transporter [Bacillus licheniformis]|nr:SMR family transporter [Bacillus licheniformis]ARC63028.1 multidrug resistance protein EbrB [Bacillus licheniformis]TWJ40427.1 Multidrug resistance protein EbrB [Bacillus licheniformis]TWJ98940.1 Multidrug resistance protein EbrB [Bacillus licheniformis]TWK06162.1 Multidrug resistance protein EbrB [Bacillus licheniformis]TWK18033.1 Multidrug resistance protein EbrB [Bacillus licheniformis]
MKGMIFLAAAILSEVFGSTMLKLSEGFSAPLPAAGVIIGFAASFTFLSFSLKTLFISGLCDLGRHRNGLDSCNRAFYISGAI